MKKALTIILTLLFLPIVYAHCPLCTAAVGAAAISANYYGFDASIIGLLIGAFGVSTGLWFGKKLKKIYIKFQLPLIVLLSFILTIIPLMYVTNEKFYLPILWYGSAGSLFNKVYWINKILFGAIIGGSISLFAFQLHNHTKKITGKILFPFQGIAITLLLLIISSIGLHFWFS